MQTSGTMDIILKKGFSFGSSGSDEGGSASPGVQLSIQHTGLIIVCYGVVVLLSLAVLVGETLFFYLKRIGVIPDVSKNPDMNHQLTKDFLSKQ